MKKLFDYVDILENNENCVVLKVSPESEKGLICLGYFTGNETMFRLTKGNVQTATVFYKDGTTFSWYWGTGGHLVVSPAIKTEGDLIQACIEQDFDICIKGTQADIENDLIIQSKKDIVNRSHLIALRNLTDQYNYTTGNSIYKDDKNYYIDAKSEAEIIQHFKDLGFTISPITKTKDRYGSKIKIFTITK